MSRKRVCMLDWLRGGAILLVVAYHILYDLVFMTPLSVPAWLTPGHPAVEAVHVGFLWVLFAVSGICSGYSRNLLRRGVLLYLAGFGGTVVTTLFLPDYGIVFGVLSGFGTCMVLTALTAPLLDRIPWPILTALGVLLWLVFRTFHKDGVLHLGFAEVAPALPDVRYLYPLGIAHPSFTSVDYFPVIPYFFMFLAGRGLHRPVSRGSFPKWFYRSHGRVLEWIGRHSLIIYAVHQPILLGILWLVDRLL